MTISGRGYIKRQPVATYRRQHRGGKGIIGHVTREEDAVVHLLVANTHDYALFFTNRGRVFSAKVHAIPDASRQAASTSAAGSPMIAAIAPTPGGTASCMNSPRRRTRRTASEKVNAPAATHAEYSPSECPAAKAAPRRARSGRRRETRALDIW